MSPDFWDILGLTAPNKAHDEKRWNNAKPRCERIHVRYNTTHDQPSLTPSPSMRTGKPGKPGKRSINSRRSPGSKVRQKPHAMISFPGPKGAYATCLNAGLVSCQVFSGNRKPLSCRSSLESCRRRGLGTWGLTQLTNGVEYYRIIQTYLATSPDPIQSRSRGANVQNVQLQLPAQPPVSHALVPEVDLSL